MTVEVFQWHIDPDRANGGEVAKTDSVVRAGGATGGQSVNSAVGEAWALLLMGSAEKLREIVQDSEAWSDRGLTLVKVAEVDCDDLSNAYALTNSIESSWVENDGVKVFASEDRCRSTSVGDVMRLNGHVHMVGMVGFTDLPELDDVLALPNSSRRLAL